MEAKENPVVKPIDKKSSYAGQNLSAPKLVLLLSRKKTPAFRSPKLFPKHQITIPKFSGYY